MHGEEADVADDVMGLLYRDHSAWLRSWLYPRVGSSSHAADFAQDVFVRLLGVLPDLQRPRAYLATVGRRLVQEHFRRQSLEQAYLESLAGLPQATALSAEELTLIRETLEALDRLLDRMRHSPSCSASTRSPPGRRSRHLTSTGSSPRRRPPLATGCRPPCCSPAASTPRNGTTWCC